MTSPKQTALLGAAAALLIAAPMLAHLSWRPLAVALGGETQGIAPWLSLGAVAVAALVAALIAAPEAWPTARSRGPRTGALSTAVGAALSAGLGGALGGAAGALSLLGVAAVVWVALPGMWGALSDAQRALPTPPPLKLALWTLMALACVAGSADLATYLGDPWAEGHGIYGDGVLYRHHCATAYLHAAELLNAGVANVYDLSLVPPMGSETWPASAAHMAPFELDRYGYPPQFLLLPLALVAVVQDFAAQRAAWACANALLFGGVVWQVGLWVGPKSGRVARWMAPMLWMLGAPTFQAGQLQLTVLGLGVLAMMAFHERRDLTGGALLASLTLAKIAPGLLGVLLLVQRRWGAVAWTVGFAVAITALSLAVTGPEVFVAFADYHLPKLASGEAFDFLDDTPRVVFENLAPFGLPFKLAALGVDLDPWVWGPRLASVYTAVAFALAFAAGRRQLDRRGQVALWLVVLTAAGLRGPMAPGYMLAGVFWAMAMVAAELRSAKGWALGGALFGLMMLATPLLPMWLPMAFVGQAAMHGVMLWLVLRRWAPLDEERAPSLQVG